MTDYTKIPIKCIPDEADTEVSACLEAAATVEKTLAAAGYETNIIEITSSYQIRRFLCEVSGSARSLASGGVELELSMALSAECKIVFEGRMRVSIEVQKKKKTVVHLTDLINAGAPDSVLDGLPAVIGRCIDGSELAVDISATPHMLVGGSTGSGKSLALTSMILSVCAWSSPDEVRLLLADPKMVEFRSFASLPHLLHPVLTSVTDIVYTLRWLNDEVDRRYTLYEKKGVRNLMQYNAAALREEKMYRILFVLDELADCMITHRNETENYIMRIAQKARAAGIHIIISTQRVSSSVITGCIKANIPTRIALRCCSALDSRVVLDASGAESLAGRGDMLVRLPTVTKPLRAQGAYVSDDDAVKIIDGIAADHPRPEYSEELKQYIEAAALKDFLKALEADDEDASGIDLIDEDENDDGETPYKYLNDEKFVSAVEAVIRNGSAATSFIQRKLSIGYGKAAMYLDAMEELGIISERDGTKAREVLIDMEEWQELLSTYQSGNVPGTPRLSDLIDPDAEGSEFAKLLRGLVHSYRDDIMKDERLVRAVDVVMEEGSAFPSLIQRKLFIGYSEAKSLIDKMTENEILSKPDENGVRTILITREKWEEAKAGNDGSDGIF